MATLEQQFARYKIRLAVNLEKGALGIEGEIHRIIAIDTKELDKSISTGTVKDRGSVLSVDVGSLAPNSVPYAREVDQGRDGQVFQYHRRRGSSRPVVFVGVGQDYMERAIEKQKEKFFSLLRSTKR